MSGAIGRQTAGQSEVERNPQVAGGEPEACTTSRRPLRAAGEPAGRTGHGGCCGGGGAGNGRGTGEQGADGLSAGHFMGGHLLHMLPMALIVLGPRIGWTWTGVLMSVAGVYYLWRRRGRMSDDKGTGVEAGTQNGSDVEERVVGIVSQRVDPGGQ